jgi:hypothetical protein
MSITEMLLYFAGFLLLLWHTMIFGYMYVNIGNSDDFSSYTNQLGMVLGVSMLGCIALAFGILALLTPVFKFTTDANVIVSILISCLAVGASVSALAIASITH